MDGISVNQLVNTLIVLGSLISTIAFVYKLITKPLNGINEKLENFEIKIAELEAEIDKLKRDLSDKVNSIERTNEKFNREFKVIITVTKTLLDKLIDDDTGDLLKNKIDEVLIDEATKSNFN